MVSYIFYIYIYIYMHTHTYVIWPVIFLCVNNTLHTDQQAFVLQ